MGIHSQLKPTDRDLEEAGHIKNVFDYPLCIAALIALPRSFAVLAANIIGVISAFIWLLWLKQWLALGIGIAAIARSLQLVLEVDWRFKQHE